MCDFRIISQRKTRGNPNFGRRDNASTPAVNNSTSTAKAPTMAANTPKLATARATALVSFNLEATLPTAPTNVAVPRSSNLLAAPMEVA